MRVSWAVEAFPGKCSRDDRAPEKRKVRRAVAASSHLPCLSRPVQVDDVMSRSAAVLLPSLSGKSLAPRRACPQVIWNSI